MRNGDWKDTDRFKIRYCFINLDPETTDGEYHIDFLDNNGEGFTYEEAVKTAREISLREGVRWAQMREITGKDFCDPEEDMEEEDWSEYSPCVHDRRREEESQRMGIDYGPSHPWDAPGMSISDFI